MISCSTRAPRQPVRRLLLPYRRLGFVEQDLQARRRVDDLSIEMERAGSGPRMV